MELTRKILERLGYSVRCATSVAGAREHMQDRMPDAIVLDNNLSDGDGIAFCRELRENAAIPVMIISDKKDDELAAFQAGASDFLKKPVDYEILKARIGVMLNVSHKASQDRDGTTGGENPIPADAGTSHSYPSNTPETQPSDVWTPTKTARKGKMAGYIYAATAVACVALTVAAIGAYNFFNTSVEGVTSVQAIVTSLVPGQNPEDNSEVYFYDEQIPLASVNIFNNDAKTYTGDMIKEAGDIKEVQGFCYVSCDIMDARAGSNQIAAALFNPDTNPCNLAFDIILQETGECLYTSDLVKPGMCVDGFAINSALGAGEYKAAMVIRAYAPDCADMMESVNIEFILRFV